MAQCNAKTKDGTLCQISAQDSQRYCHIHRRKRLIRKVFSFSALSALFLGVIGFIANIMGILGYVGLNPKSPTLTNATATHQGVVASPTPQVVYVVVTETTELNSWIAQYPVVGTQLDFAPYLSVGEKIEDLPTNLKMASSPYSGIFITRMEEEAPTSWEVHYNDGEVLPAQTEKCFINQGYPEMWQSPLNLKANDISTSVAIFVDARYSMIVKRVEVFVINYTAPRELSDIEFIKVLTPGAGGFGFPFQTVRANRVFVDKDAQIAYQIEFQDFILKPQEGVSIHIPITLVSEGNYQLQIKVIGQAIPVFNGDKEGEFTLMTGRLSYGWADIKEPLDFEVEQAETMAFTDGSSYGTVNLVPCP